MGDPNRERRAAVTSALADFIRSDREAIIQRWVAEVREQSVGHELDEERVRDSVPALLDRVAAMAEELAAGKLETRPEEVSAMHAAHRLESGYSVEELVVDHVALRQTLVSLIAERGPELEAHEWVLLHRAIDRALVDTMRYFLLARERKLRALDRLETEVVGVADVDRVLDRLIGIFTESVPAADTAMIFIREGGVLVLRASRGFVPSEGAVTMPVGEGFAGAIAAERRPHAVRDAQSDPRVLGIVRARGVRALYGVPLVHDGEVIGVTHMGSLVANEFAEEDMLLLRGLASRAAAAIAQVRFMDRLAREAQLRERLVAIVGHDLRTPLNALTMGAAHLASMHELPAVAVRTAARMLRSSQRMGRIIEDLLDFTRVRAGAVLPIAPNPVRLDDVVRDVLQEIELAHPDKHVELDARMRVEGRWDADRLRQVLTNLVDNAVTHGAGSAVRVTVDRDETDATVTVHNGGPAIQADELPHLFDPFRKGATSRRGLGLGLFIAREIVRAHGGDIAVTSRPDEGTRFVVRLPLS